MVKLNSEEVDTYLQSSDGRKTFEERVDAYCEENPTLDVSRAREESRNDFIEVNQTQRTQEIRDEIEAKHELLRRRLQIKRLGILHDLIKLEAAHNRIKPTPSSRSHLVGFDVHLVSMLKKEPWYVQAKD